MPKFFYITKRTKKAQIRKEKRFSITTKMLNTLFCSLLLVSIISYLAQVNNIATKGYTIKELESQMAELKQINRELEAQSLKLQSIKNVSEKVSGLRMEVAKNVEYIEEVDKVVAR